MPIKPFVPLLAVGLVVAAMVSAQGPGDPDDRTPIAPAVPGADRYQTGRVFLERADTLRADEKMGEYQLLIGRVEFRKADMFMYCDSAHFYDARNSFEAFGNVRMEQGDTLFVYGDELDYDGITELAVLYADPGKKVRLINRDVELTTDIFNYDLGIDLGYYTVGGTLADKRNTLKSLEGEYSPSTKDANFYTDVELESVSEKGDTVYIYTDTLHYNTDTRIAELTCPSRIVGKDGTIYTSNGVFDTNTNRARLFDRSVVHMSNGNTLTGDTLFYDKEAGYGEAFGYMVLVDSARQSSLEGDYGFYNERTDSAFATGRARALEYSQKDTLYLHGDTIRSFLQPEDSTHIMIANPRVRFYRVDMQGICDSLTFLERDSTIYMDRHPVVWTGTRQVFGNVIQVHMNDSTVDRATLPEFGFMAEHIDEEFFNQLSGKEMIAYMEDGELRRLDVNGNVQGIMLPMENDSTYNKIANVESSYMKAYFRGREIEKANLWPETSGTVTPLYLAKKSLFRLPQFQWYEVMRPTSPDDIFVVPPEMVALFASPDPAPRAPKPVIPKPAGPPAVQPPEPAGEIPVEPAEETSADDSSSSDEEEITPIPTTTTDNGDNP